MPLQDCGQVGALILDIELRLGDTQVSQGGNRLAAEREQPETAVQGQVRQTVDQREVPEVVQPETVKSTLHKLPHGVAGRVPVTIENNQRQVPDQSVGIAGQLARGLQVLTAQREQNPVNQGVAQNPLVTTLPQLKTDPPFRGPGRAARQQRIAGVLQVLGPNPAFLRLQPFAQGPVKLAPDLFEPAGAG